MIIVDTPGIAYARAMPPTTQEDELLVKGYRKWGNSWTKIAQMIGGRTDNAVSSAATRF